MGNIQFWADAVGVPVAGNSISDLQYQFFRNVSRLPANSYYTRNDHEYDYYLMRLGLTAPLAKSINDLREMYYDSIGVGTEAEYESGSISVRTNLCINPSFEANTAIWTGASGAAISRVTSEFQSGVACLQSVNPGVVAPEGPGIVGGNIPALPNLPYIISLYSKSPAASSFDLTLRSEGAGNTDVTSVVTGTDAWQRNSTTAVSRSDAAFVSGSLRGKVIQALTLWVDSCLIEQSAVLGAYFDGNTPGARWLGAPNNSQSQLVTWTP